jgi:hypothetical protein
MNKTEKESKKLPENVAGAPVRSPENVAGKRMGTVET